MTPEEQLTRIAKLLQTLTESQVRQQETLTGHDAEIEKNNAAIRDLIVVSRTLVDSQKEVTAHIEKLREAQQVTDDKLHALINTVDRIIRQQNL